MEVCFLMVEKAPLGFVMIVTLRQYSVNRNTGFFCRQVSVKIVLFVIQLESNRGVFVIGFFCLLGYFVVLAVQSNGQNNPISTVHPNDSNKV